MISWMQKHNRYLVWTIWVATIAFIGAGFVGWGSYNFGAKAGNVAKVGDVEISRSKFDMAYNNLYQQYNQMLGGKLDQAQAKKMGLAQQAFSRVETEAKLLNLAKELGIVVSDKELADYLASIPAFQKDGHFDKSIYEGYLQTQRLKAKTFEARLREEMAIRKTLGLFNVPPYAFEEEAIGSAMRVADKIAYRVLTEADAVVDTTPEKVKAYWENHKEEYTTTKMYNLSILWTSTDEANVTDEELKNFYETNSFNYTDAKGKQLSFEDAKDLVERDLKLKKSKKTAQKAYIAFKKGEQKGNEEITLPEGDKKLSTALWNVLRTKENGSILKPKVVGDYYATVKLNSITMPRVKSFEEAKEAVTADYKNQAKKEGLMKLADESLKSFDESRAILSDYISLKKDLQLQALNGQESIQFVQKLFSSNKEKGMIAVGNKIVLYKIKDQKLLPTDKEKDQFIKQTTSKIKSNTFEQNLIELLDSRYPTEVFIRGVKN